MKLLAVPYAGDGYLQGVEVFDSKEKAEKFVKKMRRKYNPREKLDIFIKSVEIKQPHHKLLSMSLNCSFAILNSLISPLK